VEYTEEIVYGVPEEEWEYYEYAPAGNLSTLLGMHGLTLVAIILVAFMGYKIATSRVDTPQTDSPPPASPVMQSDPLPAPDFTAVVSPYDAYTLTQGIHGGSYGHMAIDIAAGQGVTIKSPIHGVVSELYVDAHGNPTLVIENEVYKVMMLHGEYTVSIGQQVELGQAVGVESNLGYTTDMAGVPCWGRDCGYHTHLNIFDKRIGGNVNPLTLIGN
jgi:murein DD-endopeptidase MepM/ murein hydrolase activator NlpD